MPQDIALTTKRRHAVAAQLLVTMVREIGQVFFASERGGAMSGDILIYCAVIIGQADKRLMTPGKIAAYVGIPRPTVVRRLKRMSDAGLVRCDGGHYRVPRGRLAQPDASECTAYLSRVIQRTAASLSKMDTSGLAPASPRVISYPSRQRGKTRSNRK